MDMCWDQSKDQNVQTTSNKYNSMETRSVFESNEVKSSLICIHKSHKHF